LFEYKVSAVVELYELNLAERRRFVKIFLELKLPRSSEQRGSDRKTGYQQANGGGFNNAFVD
jgi:hypothetical protein